MLTLLEPLTAKLADGRKNSNMSLGEMFSNLLISLAILWTATAREVMRCQKCGLSNGCRIIRGLVFCFEEAPGTFTERHKSGRIVILRRRNRPTQSHMTLELVSVAEWRPALLAPVLTQIVVLPHVTIKLNDIINLVRTIWTSELFGLGRFGC
jgi:hypothetical protein